jgi:hypothetical protein
MEQTIRDWFLLLPDNGVSQRAIDNTNNDRLRFKVHSLDAALRLGFDWKHSPEGLEFWDKVAYYAREGHYEKKKIKTSDTLKAVINDLESRELRGLSKYKTTVDRDDLLLRDWLQHAYEEVLDQAMYLKRAIFLIDEQAR